MVGLRGWRGLFAERGEVRRSKERLGGRRNRGREVSRRERGGDEWETNLIPFTDILSSTKEPLSFRYRIVF